MEYALYRGEVLLHTGTLEEIARSRGVKKETIYYYSMPAYERKRANSKKGNYLVAVKLD